MRTKGTGCFALLLAAMMVLGGCSSQRNEHWNVAPEQPPEVDWREADCQQGVETEEADLPEEEAEPTTITFPAYQEGKNGDNADIYATEPFSVQMQLPQGWTVEKPSEQQIDTTIPLFNQLLLVKDGQQMATIGFNIYEDAEGVPAEQYYQVVYAGIRLGSIYFWNLDPYQPLTSWENGETALATVCYQNQEELAEGTSAAGAESIEVPGIVSYDKERKAYIGIQFAEGTEQALAEQIAESIVWKDL